MNDVDALGLGLLILRVWIGVVMFAHGYRHIFGGGKIQGTAGWFASLGMKPGIVHAWLASLTELGAAASLITGTLVPLGAAGVIGTMFVAFVTNHRPNGFFIFYKGEGYEYVMTLVCTCLGLSAIGAGKFSVDHLLELDWTQGATGFYIGLAGLAGALGLLAAFWRPEKKTEAA